MSKVTCTPDLLDEVRNKMNSEGNGFSHFTIGKGKAIYHYLHVPDGTVGNYYALRVSDFGLEGRRAIHSDKLITVYEQKEP